MNAINGPDGLLRWSLTVRLSTTSTLSMSEMEDRCEASLSGSSIPIKIELDGRGVKLGPVVELHALAELKGDLGRAVNCPLGGQRRNQFGLVIHRQQAIRRYSACPIGRRNRFDVGSNPSTSPVPPIRISPPVGMPDGLGSRLRGGRCGLGRRCRRGGAGLMPTPRWRMPPNNRKLLIRTLIFYVLPYSCS